MLNMYFYTHIVVDKCVLPELIGLAEIYFHENKREIATRDISVTSLVDVFLSDKLSQLNYVNLYELSIAFDKYIESQFKNYDPILWANSYQTARIPVSLSHNASKNWLEQSNNSFLEKAKKTVAVNHLDVAGLDGLFLGFIVTAFLIKELLIFEHPKYFAIDFLKSIEY